MEQPKLFELETNTGKRAIRLDDVHSIEEEADGWTPITMRDGTVIMVMPAGAAELKAHLGVAKPTKIQPYGTRGEQRIITSPGPPL